VLPGLLVLIGDDGALVEAFTGADGVEGADASLEFDGLFAVWLPHPVMANKASRGINLMVFIDGFG